jgi:hypothetical protein
MRSVTIWPPATGGPQLGRLPQAQRPSSVVLTNLQLRHGVGRLPRASSDQMEALGGLVMCECGFPAAVPHICAFTQSSSTAVVRSSEVEAPSLGTGPEAGQQQSLLSQTSKTHARSRSSTPPARQRSNSRMSDRSGSVSGTRSTGYRRPTSVGPIEARVNLSSDMRTYDIYQASSRVSYAQLRKPAQCTFNAGLKCLIDILHEAMPGELSIHKTGTPRSG